MKNNKVKSKNNKIIIIILLLLILSGIWIFKDNFGVRGKDGYLTEGTNGLLPGITKEEAMRMLQERADKSMFSFDINSIPTFENGKSKGNVRIANPPYNLYDMQVTIRLDGTNDVVLKTEKLKPNQYIEEARLIKNLKKGEYKATASFEGYDIDSGEYQGVVQAAIVIRILN